MRAGPTPPPLRQRAGEAWRAFLRLPDSLALRCCGYLYTALALVTAIEAISKQPLLANLAGSVMAVTLVGERVHGLPDWADGTRVYLTDRLPPGVAGLAAGTTLFIARDQRHDESLLRHELVHARQYQRHTTIGFTATYLWHGISLLARYPGQPQRAYYLHPFEIDAYRAQFDFWNASYAIATADSY